MLTFNPNTAKSRPDGYDKPFLLLVLCFVWIITGLWGHEPWKSNELMPIALIKHFYDHGLSLIPVLGGEALLQTPPLYYWVATLLGHMLSPWLLPLHDAARLTTGLFMALTLLGIGQATRLFYAANTGRLAVISLIGTIGMIIWGHFLSTEVATLAGLSLTLWGTAAALQTNRYRFFLLIAGNLLVFWSGSLYQAIICLLLPYLFLISPYWRKKTVVNTLLICLPFILLLAALWPLLLWLQSPALLWQWINHDGSLNLMLSPFAADGLSYYFRRLSWLALPVLPLALWRLWDKKGQWAAPEHASIITFIVWFSSLSLTNQKQDILALPLYLPLAILAAGAIDTLHRGSAAALNWFGRLAFGVFGLYVWIVWAAANLYSDSRLGQQAATLAPDFAPSFEPVAILFGLLFSATWIRAIFLKRTLARQAITNWTLGITMLWGLVVALTLPWFDASKSYKTMSQDLIRSLPHNYDCIDVSSLNLNIGGALVYYGATSIRHDEKADQCSLVLIRGNNKASTGTPYILWQGGPSWSRGKEWYLLLKR